MSDFYTNIFGNGNRIHEFGLQEVATVAALPATGTTGQSIFVVADSLVYTWDGTAWVANTDTNTEYTATAPMQVDGSNVITIDAATGATAGSMSSADKTKLDASTNAATASTLIQRDASGNAEVAYPTADSHIATKAYVDDQILELGQFVGSHDASTGLPTTGSGDSGDIEGGDLWVVSVAGTIPGLMPITDLTVGDVLIASVDGASVASQFVAIQRNLDEPVTPLAKYAETVTLLNATSTTITHNLGTTDVVIYVRRTSDNRSVRVRETTVTTNTIELHATGVGSGLEVRVVVIG